MRQRSRIALDRMQSPNLEMYTTAGERSARDTLRYFEQVHSFFAQTMPSTVKALPVRIVAFNSAKVSKTGVKVTDLS